MAFIENKNVVVRGLAAAVPANIVEIRDIYRQEWGNVDDFINGTTIERLHISHPDQTASDLCVTASEKLLSELEWSKDSIDAIIFVTQTPDYYFVPATACHIQNRLGLGKGCLAFDMTLGCSGWVYGIGVLSSLINNGTIKRALLLAGDTCSKTANPEDQGSAPLFGDAGTATALEFNPEIKLVELRLIYIQMERVMMPLYVAKGRSERLLPLIHSLGSVMNMVRSVHHFVEKWTVCLFLLLQYHKLQNP